VIVGAGICGISQLAQAIAWTISPGSQAAGTVVVAFNGLFTFFYVAWGKSIPATFHFHEHHNTVFLIAIDMRFLG